MNYEKYLPIGTVVKLKDGTKKIMITGFYCTKKEANKIFDYSGCLYPEGLISMDKFYFFDHVQIQNVYHIGLIDDEERNFKEKLVEISNKLNNIMKEM